MLPRVRSRSKKKTSLPDDVTHSVTPVSYTHLPLHPVRAARAGVLRDKSGKPVGKILRRGIGKGVDLHAGGEGGHHIYEMCIRDSLHMDGALHARYPIRAVQLRPAPIGGLGPAVAAVKGGENTVAYQRGVLPAVCLLYTSRCV